uniref:PH domain-containing protein n=1 Tax=Denticeps clupeoides TaxID=299321 RepID=A0AAY4C452_9TELE
GKVYESGRGGGHVRRARAEMAGPPATSNGATERKGRLLKRAHFTRRWKPTWFRMVESKLLYGGKPENLHKTINLVGADVRLVDCDPNFGWSITPKDGGRTFFLRASTAEEQQAWMESICEAQLASQEHGSNACVLQ